MPTTRSRRALRPVDPEAHPAQALVDQYEALTLQKKQIDVALTQLKAALLRAAKAGRRGIVDTGTHTITLISNPGAPRVDPAKLLALGVTSTIITKATVSTPYEYAKVAKKKAEGETVSEGVA